MVKKRARISDNDPLSATDAVLAGYEQVSKLTSQQPDQSASEKVANQDNPEVNTNQLVNQLTTQEVNQLESQPAIEPPSHPQTQSESQPDNKPASQQVDQLKKVTFQIGESVVKRLNRKHLELQLELGKENTPYKEVIVEEAVSLILDNLDNNPDEWLKRCQTRQQARI